MGLLDRIRGLKLSKTEPKPDANPWASPEPAAVSVGENPWKDKRFWNAPAPKPAPVASPWTMPHRGIGKNWILHKVAFAVILLNVGLGLFFTSNNQMFNAALYTYLGASTILLSHYWGMTR